MALAILFSINGLAQDRQDNGWADGQPQMERIHSIKVAYITDRLHLTVEQSQQFWPVYNAYEKEQKALWNNFKKKYKGADKTDDNVARQMFDDRIDVQDAQLDLKRKYKDQFLKIISPQQLGDLFKAESEFIALLKQRLNEKRGGNGARWQRDNNR